MSTWFALILNKEYYRGADNNLQREKIFSFIYPIYNHNWKNISTTYIYI